MTLQVPPSGVLLKKQLWNMSLLNNGSSPLNIRISLVVSDGVNGQPLFTATTGTIVLNNGVKQIQATDLPSVQYEYLNASFASRDPDGFMTVGYYQACYTILGYTGETEGPLTEDCAFFDVEPLSPPVLNAPADNDSLLTGTPQFTWMPPTPLNMFSGLSYQFTLVQVLPGQNTLDAIQQNIPVYSTHSCTDIFLNYPLSAMALDTGKLYAWQVIAQNNQQPAAQSEIWTFRIAGNNILIPLIDEGAYVKLKREEDASISVCKGVVKFDYSNIAGDSTVDYQIRRIAGDDITTVVKSGSISLKFGENMISLPFLYDERLKDNGAYLLELVNSRNETWHLKFLYKDPAPINGQ